MAGTRILLDLGSSAVRAQSSATGEPFKCVMFPEGEGRSAGMSAVLPTVIAIPNGTDSEIPQYGYQGLKAYGRYPGSYYLFTNIKSGLIEEAHLDSDSRKALNEDRAKLASLPGSKSTMTSYALQFLSYVADQLGVACSKGEKVVAIYFNILDCWKNGVANAFSEHFATMFPDAELYPVNEAWISTIGIMSRYDSDTYMDRSILTVDIGHATMDIAEVTTTMPSKVAAGNTRNNAMRLLSIGAYQSHPFGAGKVNTICKDKLGTILTSATSDLTTQDHILFELDVLIDEEFKNTANDNVAKPWKWNDDEWSEASSTILGVLEFWTDNVVKKIVDKLERARCSSRSERPMLVIINGRGSKSPRLQVQLKRMTVMLQEQGFQVELLFDNGSTPAVLIGLQLVAEDPALLSPRKAPASIWLRTDPPPESIWHLVPNPRGSRSSSERSKSSKAIGILCKRSKPSKAIGISRKRLKPSKAIGTSRKRSESSKAVGTAHESYDGDWWFLGSRKGTYLDHTVPNGFNPFYPTAFSIWQESPSELITFDLRVGTPKGKSEKDQILVTKPFERSPKTWYYTTSRYIDIIGGKFLDIKLKHTKDGDFLQTVWVYIYQIWRTRFSLDIYVVYAEDGHEMKHIESESFGKVIQYRSPTDEWRFHDETPLVVLWGGTQTARTESLSPDTPGIISPDEADRKRCADAWNPWSSQEGYFDWLGFG